MASDLMVKIGGDTEDVKQSIEGLGESLAEMVGEINPIAGAAVTAIAGIGIAAIDAGENFEGFYNTIIQRTGATGEDLDGLKESFDAVFASAPVDGGALAEALSLISQRLHLTGDDLTAFTEQVTKLSLVTGEDLKTQTDAITRAFLNWGTSTDDQKAKLDELYAISQQTGVSVTTLAGTIADVGVQARMSGEDFDQTAQKVAYLASQGIDAQGVYAALGRVQAQFVKNGVDSKATLDDLIFTITNTTTANEGLQKAVELLGPKLGPKLAELIQEGKLSIDDLNKSIADTKTTIESTYAATETFGQKLTTFWHNLETVLEPIGSFAVEKGKGFLDWLNLATYTVTGNTDAFNKLSAEIFKTTAATDANSHSQLDANESKKESIEAAKALTESLNAEGLGITVVTDGASKAGAAHHDLAAELAAGKAITEALTHVQELLTKADTDHAEYLKSVYVPSIQDVGTAEQNLAEARADYLAKDEAEQALRAQLAIASGGAVIALEAQIKVASADSAAARLVYSEAEKTLTQSKTDATAVSALLLAADHALSEETKAVHIPTLVSLADADAAVADSQTNLADKTKALQDARQALSDFSQSHTLPDDTTEQQLKDRLTTATKDETDAINAEKQAVSDRSTVARVGQALDQDIFNGQKQLTEYYKSTVLPTYTDLTTSLDNIQRAKEAQKDAADNLKAAIQAETDVHKSETSTEQDATAAKNATKKAEDDLKASTLAVNAAEEIATRDHGLNKAALDLLPASVKGVTDAHATLEAAVTSLGLKTTDMYSKLAQSADDAYKAILALGTTNGELLRTAQIADIQAQIDKYKSMGQDVPADQQLLLASLKQQETDYQTNSLTQWTTLWNNIYGAVSDVFTNLNKDIVTGNWADFKKNILGDLQKIGESVLTLMVKPFEDAVSKLITDSLTNLLSGNGLGGVMDDLKKIGDSITGIFSSTSSVATTATSAGSTAASAGSSAASAGTSAASSGTGAASSASSGLLGTVASVTGIVTGIISAGSGVYSNFQQANIEDTLHAMHNDTSYLAWNFDQGGLHGSILTMGTNLDNFVNGAFGGWYHDYLVTQGDLAFDVSERAKDIVPAIKDGISMVTAKLDILISQSSVVVNVKAYLDSKEISAQVETQIENAVRLAIS